MEDFPGRPSPEVPDDDQDKKKKRKKSARLPLPLISVGSDAEPEKTEKREPSVLDKALADLAVRKREQAEESEQSGNEKKASKAEQTDETTSEAAEEADADERTADPAEGANEGTSDAASKEESQHKAKADIKDETEEAPELLPEYTLSPNEFGGEFIIHLQGDKPVAEHVVPADAKEGSREVAPSEEVPEAEPQLAQYNPAMSELRSLDEQQRQTHTVPTSEAASDSTNPGVTPETSADASLAKRQAERPDWHSVPANSIESTQIHHEYAEHQAAAQEGAPVSKRGATKQEMEDALYYATKTGQNRGVVTGLLVGGAYEHFKHKRREKRAEKRYRAQSKQLDSVRQDSYFNQQEQAKRQAESDARLNAAERRYESSEQRLREGERRFQTADARFQNSVQNGPERPKPAARQPELAVRTPERQRTPEQVAAAEKSQEQLTVPPEHYLQTSAWHTIEMDAKTGRPVEKPSFQYGHEYYRERAYESTPTQQRNAAAGGVALAGATGVAPQTSGSGAGGTAGAGNDVSQVVPPPIPSATTKGAPPSATQSTTNGAPSRAAKVTDSGPRLWPWLVALAVIIIGLIALLG